MKEFFLKINDWFELHYKEVLFGLIFLIAAAGMLTFVYLQIQKTYKDVFSYHNYTSFEIYNETNTLVYDSIKLRLLNEVDAYIAKATNNTSALNGIVLIDNCLKYDIDLCFVLAQAEQESHFGTQGLARKTNSVFNVFAFDGHSYDAINKNGKYDHPNDCVAPYMALLKRDYLVDNKTEYDLLNEFVNKYGKRYASSETYEDSLVSKITKIKNETTIDSTYQRLRRQGLLLGKNN